MEHQEIACGGSQGPCRLDQDGAIASSASGQIADLCSLKGANLVLKLPIRHEAPKADQKRSNRRPGSP